MISVKMYDDYKIITNSHSIYTWCSRDSKSHFARNLLANSRTCY